MRDGQQRGWVGRLSDVHLSDEAEVNHRRNPPCLCRCYLVIGRVGADDSECPVRIPNTVSFPEGSGGVTTEQAVLPRSCCSHAPRLLAIHSNGIIRDGLDQWANHIVCNLAKITVSQYGWG